MRQAGRGALCRCDALPSLQERGYLPKKWSSEVDGLEEATAHEVIHTFAYHLAVTKRLRATQPSNQTVGRKTLCDIKYQILNNEFEY